jgi:beta-glucosidase
MVRSLALLGCATAVAGQFDFIHTQYETSPPVYPSRELKVPLI